MLEGQRDKGWKVDCGQIVEQIKFGLYSVKEIWIVQREGVERWNWYPGSADLISGQIWKRGLERETTIGGPISVFQAAIYHKQVVGILVLRMKLREIVLVLKPHPLLFCQWARDSPGSEFLTCQSAWGFGKHRICCCRTQHKNVFSNLSTFCQQLFYHCTWFPF